LSGTAVVDGLLGGTGSRTVSGFGPVAFQGPKYFSITALASSGDTIKRTKKKPRMSKKGNASGK
jgi:hypothetical protein